MCEKEHQAPLAGREGRGREGGRRGRVGGEIREGGMGGEGVREER